MTDATIKAKVLRFDPDKDEKPYYQLYDVPVDRQVTVKCRRLPPAKRQRRIEALDAEIASVFEPGDLITPDEVRGEHATLDEAVEVAHDVEIVPDEIERPHGGLVGRSRVVDGGAEPGGADREVERIKVFTKRISAQNIFRCLFY